jgi:prepilin-type N-terminal cleavage/methylation domain-containing protein
MKKRQKIKRNGGFTLIELLVVIAIISFLATTVMVALSSARQKSRDAVRLSDMQTIRTALELYYSDHNGYPSTGGTLRSECAPSNFLNADVIPNLASEYIGHIPSDPFMQKDTGGGLGDNCYIYVSNGIDYAFVDMGTDINLASHPELIDPTRDFPVGNNCEVDGVPLAWKVFSQGWRCI